MIPPNSVYFGVSILQLLPASVVFQTPPPTLPTYQVFEVGSSGSTTSPLARPAYITRASFNPGEFCLRLIQRGALFNGFFKFINFIIHRILRLGLSIRNSHLSQYPHELVRFICFYITGSSSFNLFDFFKPLLILPRNLG